MPRPIVRQARRILEELPVVLRLVKRDYAVQYAGTGLGILWLLVQYVFQIAVFFLIFGVFLPGGRSAGSAPHDFLFYLLGGMTLWMPLSEMLQRSGSILYDNRALVRRTAVGLRLFLWIPLLQSFLHYLILALPILLAGFFRGVDSTLWPLGLLWGLFVLLFFSGWSILLARISILIKDVSPVMRLLLQVLFWITPIAYRLPERLLPYMRWNPLYGVVELHRRLLFQTGSVGLADIATLLFPSVALFAAFSLAVYALSRIRLKTIIVDQL